MPLLVLSNLCPTGLYIQTNVNKLDFLWSPLFLNFELQTKCKRLVLINLSRLTSLRTKQSLFVVQLDFFLSLKWSSRVLARFTSLATLLCFFFWVLSLGSMTWRKNQRVVQLNCGSYCFTRLQFHSKNESPIRRFARLWKVATKKPRSFKSKWPSSRPSSTFFAFQKLLFSEERVIYLQNTIWRFNGFWWSPANSPYLLKNR